MGLLKRISFYKTEIISLTLIASIYGLASFSDKEIKNINRLYAQLSWDGKPLPNYGKGHFDEVYRRLDYINNCGIYPSSHITRLQMKTDELLAHVPILGNLKH